MRTVKLGDMVKGWFVGDFSPVAYRTPAAEVAVKEYKTGDAEERHVHRIATEITLVLKGMVQMNGVRYGEGEIVVLEPGEATDFRCLADAVTVVVKVPGAKNDKFPVDGNA